MIIGIDGNEANVRRRVGISEYAKNLLDEFSKESSGKKDLKFRIYLKDKPLSFLPGKNSKWSYRVFGPKRLWTQIALPFVLYLDIKKPDVFFSPTHYAPRFCPVPSVISIMDLSYIHFPQMFKAGDLFQLQSWTAYSVKKASKILTISKASRDDIIKVYKLEDSKVAVTYPGIKMTQISPKINIKEKYKIKGDYVLFVGTLQPRKNILRLIEAFAVLAKDIPSLSLVIIGKKGWLYEEILKGPVKFGIEDKVRFLDFVQDNDLDQFYKNALFFVLPSLYEGFGLPVLEAMKNGCPVIASNISSLPEAGGDAALYIDPLDVSDMTSKMAMLVTNSKLRANMVKKGYEHIKKFSWEDTASQTLGILQEVLEK